MTASYASEYSPRPGAYSDVTPEVTSKALHLFTVKGWALDHAASQYNVRPNDLKRAVIKEMGRKQYIRALLDLAHQRRCHSDTAREVEKILGEVYRMRAGWK